MELYFKHLHWHLTVLNYSSSLKHVGGYSLCFINSSLNLLIELLRWNDLYISWSLGGTLSYMMSRNSSHLVAMSLSRGLFKHNAQKTCNLLQSTWEKVNSTTRNQKNLFTVCYIQCILKSQWNNLRSLKPLLHDINFSLNLANIPNFAD